MEKYTIDLDTILLILGGFHQNGMLYGDVPVRKLNNKVPLKAQLRLLEGGVISCFILDEKGTVVMAGDAALKALRGAGQLNWTMIQEVEQPSSFSPSVQDRFSGPSEPRPPAITTDPRLSALPTDPRLSTMPTEPRLPVAPNWKMYPQLSVPHRLVIVTTEQMRQGQWPRNHRLVYGMIDGVRTIEKIAELLSLHPQEVDQIARDLQIIKVVALDY